MAEDCVFCDIISGDASADIMQWWDDAVALRPLNPVTDGHLLVVPRRHVDDALAIPRVTSAVMYRAAQIAYRPCNIITSCGPEATQTVMHLHVHIVPRREGDGLALPWTGQEASVDG